MDSSFSMDKARIHCQTREAKGPPKRPFDYRTFCELFAVNSFLKQFSGNKFRLNGCRNFDFFTGGRIASGSGGTFGRFKSTETDQRDFITSLYRFDHLGNKGL